MIPSIIYQTYRSVNPPDEFKVSRDMLTQLNPTHNYVYLNDDDATQFIHDYYGTDMVCNYLKINPKYGPARADLLRYLLIYETGGAYFDIKSAVNCPLDTIINSTDRYLLSKWSPPLEIKYNELRNVHNPMGYEYQNWHIIGEPKHPILEQTIKDVIENINHPYATTQFGKSGVLQMTGPIAYTKAIYKITDITSYRVLTNELQSGLLYNTIGNHPYCQAHVNMFTNHYSTSKEPIILPKCLS
jgi:mannosyltransferase OCH1-like enzyme